MHTLIDCRIDDVAPADDIGLNSFKRVVLAGRNLFQRSRMDDDRHTGKSPLKSSLIANIPEEIPQAGMVEASDAHVVLLQLIAAEDDQALGPVFLQHDLDELFPK